MPTVSIDLDISGYVAQVEQTRGRDIPFATAKALTRTAQDAQSEVRREVQYLFKLRNNWTQRGIRMKPAEKLSWPIMAEVYTDTGNNSAPDYLLAQENSDLKLPHNGHAHIAVPTLMLRNLIGDRTVIPAALRPRELLSAFDAMHTSVRTRGLVRTPKALQCVGWIAPYKGHDYIFARPAAQNKARPIPMYLLLPETHVRAVLGMEQTVEKVADARFETHWDDAWDSISR